MEVIVAFRVPAHSSCMEKTDGTWRECLVGDRKSRVFLSKS